MGRQSSAVISDRDHDYSRESTRIFRRRELRVDQDSGTTGIPVNGMLVIFVHENDIARANNAYRSDEVSERISAS